MAAEEEDGVPEEAGMVRKQGFRVWALNYSPCCRLSCSLSHQNAFRSAIFRVRVVGLFTLLYAAALKCATTRLSRKRGTLDHTTASTLKPKTFSLNP